MKSKTQYVLFFLFLILFSFALDSSVKCKEVQFVFHFITNGYSSPNATLTESFRDLFREKWSDNNMLTLRGMKHFFEIGQKLRNYLVNKIGLLNSEFNHNQIKINSLEENDTILSSYLLMTGLYPPPFATTLGKSEIRKSEPNFDYYDSDNLYKQLKFNALPHNSQQFPIKSFPPENRYFGLNNPKNCKGVAFVVQEHINKKKMVTDFMKNFKEKYSTEMLKVLRMNVTHFNKYNKIHEVCETYLKDYHDLREFKILNNTTINKKELFQDCLQFMNMNIYDVIHGDKDNMISRISMTKIMHRLLDFLDEKIDAVIFEDNLNFYLNNVRLNLVNINKDYDNEFKKYVNNEKLKNKDIADLKKEGESLQNYLLYSGQQIDIGSLLSFLHFTFNTTVFYPDFGSNVFIELVQNKENPVYDPNTGRFFPSNQEKKFFSSEDFNVYIFFNKEKILEIPYPEFKKKILKNIISDDFINDFCQFEDDNSLLFKIAAMILFIICGLIGFWIYKMTLKPKNLNKYEAMNEELEGGDNYNVKNNKKDENYENNQKYNENEKENKLVVDK